MEDKPLLTILMATFNGEKFLVEQLESILAQSYQNWELIIRDDNSTDSIQSIISAFIKRDSRIKQIQYGTLHGTACRNFSQLFDWAYQQEKVYVLFADQDDIWLPNKIELSLKEIQEAEIVYGTAVPLVKYSGFNFIDDKGISIDKHLKLPDKLSLKVLLTENYAWGCTMIMNQPAINLVKHIPPESVNHDYYIALVVSAFGQVSLINQALVLYRQHESNVSGNIDKMSLKGRFNRYFKNINSMIEPLTQNLALVKSFYQNYADRLDQVNKKKVSGFLESYQSNFFKLLKTMLRLGILKIGFGKNMVYFYTLFLYRKQVIENIYNPSGNEDTLR